jgi:glycosyltransferase involved in cell wall biosynthesis
VTNLNNQTLFDPEASINKAMQIAVIVPVRNEQESIAPLLDRLLAQTRRPSQIVITDAGSTDATTSIIETYIKKGAPVELVRSGPAMPGRGRNLAVEASTCEWLAFIDGGILPELDWLDKLALRVSERHADVVYGDWQPIIDSFFKECAAIAYVPPPEKRDGAIIRPAFIASSMMRRDVWTAVGGFPEDLRSAEDLLFMRRIEQKRFHIAFEPRAVVHWSLQPSLWPTLKRFVVYGRNNIRAGLWKEWQLAVARQYVVLALLCVAAAVLGPRWLLAPLLLWFLLLSARSFKSLWKNRTAYPAGFARQMRRFVALIPIIATLDAAALWSIVLWLWLDKFGFRGSR